MLNTIFTKWDEFASLHKVFKVETINEIYMVAGGLPYPKIQNGEVIEMRLDLKELTLKFKVNDKVIVDFVDIEDTAYRAAVSTYKQQDRITLISYQDIYK